MECNKDEELRAKEIAERKFGASDISGAKKFALKAQNLFPGLAGIAQMLATLEVYISAENKVNEEVDWYGVLGVSSQSDVETMRKQYRKMALALHPDKNSFIGADGAFKLISKAWTLLSDKDKRVIYDQKRNAKGKTKAPPASVRRSKASSGTNRPNSNTGSSTTNLKTHKCSTKADQSSNYASASTPKTLRTECYHCKMQHEVSLTHLCQIIDCPSCHKPFLATESATPAPGFKTSTPGKCSQQKSSTQQGASKNTSNAASSTAGTTKSKSPGKGAYIFWTICDHCKRHHRFSRMYLNRNIRCPCCHEAFLTQETPPPTNGSEPYTSDSFHQRKNLDNPRVSKSASNAGSYAYAADKRKPDSQTFHNSTRAHEDSLLQQTSKKVKI